MNFKFPEYDWPWPWNALFALALFGISAALTGWYLHRRRMD